jgi:hypothetical protein
LTLRIGRRRPTRLCTLGDGPVPHRLVAPRRATPIA